MTSQEVHSEPRRVMHPTVDLGEVMKKLKADDPDFAVTFEILLAAFNLRKPDAAERWRQIFGNLEAQFRMWGKRVRWNERRLENSIRENSNAGDIEYQTKRVRELSDYRKKLLQAGNRLQAMRQIGEAFADRYIGRTTDLVDHKTGRQVLAKRTDLGPTPETYIKPGRIKPIDGLYVADHIEHQHLRAANEIAWLVETLTKLCGCRAKDLEANGGGRRDASAMPMRVAELYSGRYVPWCRDQRNLTRIGTRNLDLCLAVIVYGEGILSARQRHRLGYERAVSYIRSGLDDYARLMETDRVPEPASMEAK